MNQRDQENEALMEQLTNREAGVAELEELYKRVEDIYVAASYALEQDDFSIASNATN